MSEWATVDTINRDDKIEHISGTLEKAGGKLVFWMTQPRPKGITMDDWDKMQQDKWNKIFGKREVL